MNSPKYRFNVTVDGQDYLVEVQDINADPIIATVADKEFVVCLKDTLKDEPKVVATPKPVTPVAAPPVKASAPTPVDPCGDNVVAPMPGDLIEIYVKPGEEVDVGQPLCSLEAMKMKNTIRSPRAGVISSVPVTPGQAVSYGEVLVTFE